MSQIMNNRLITRWSTSHALMSNVLLCFRMWDNYGFIINSASQNNVFSTNNSRHLASLELH
jgi:hypothetical protein